jgi:hypothetical protein
VPTLTKQLKASVKAAKNGTLKTALRPAAGLPEGAMIDAQGEFVLPGNPATCADLLYKVREARLALQRLAEYHQELETKISNFFIDTLPRTDTTGISGVIARVQINIKPIPQVEDWDKLYAYVIKHKAFELLQRRLGEKAINERLEAGEGARMGVTVMQIKKVSCTKL